jgi:RNA polymerase sigma-70 factor, ECF subfamily
MDEAVWIARAKAGDPDAFAALFARYERRIFAHLLRQLGEHLADDAADLTQLTFVKAYLALGRTDARLNLNAWLYRIAGNLSVDWHRRNARLRPFDAALHDRTDEDRRRQPEARVLAAETQRAVVAALRAMRPRYREVLLLAERDNLSHKEIAATLGQTPGAVKSLLFRARAEFRGLYAAESGPEAARAA